MKEHPSELELTLKDSPMASPLAGDGIHFKVNPETAEKLETLRRHCGWSYVELLQEAIDGLLETRGESNE